MKLFNILTAGVLLCAGLASCEMKDELKGSGEGSSDMGYLDLGVAVNASQNNVSRADGVTDEGENENVGVSIPTGDFPVIITNVDDPSDPIKYESFDQLKEENKDGIVALPVGTYTVTAHSNDVLEGEMDVPYYEGTEEINITKDVKSETHVVCTMKNTKIALSYDTEFIANFTNWTITVTDGTTVLTFECTNNEDVTQLNPAPKYMWVADGVSELTVHASGYNLKGEFVSEERVLTKPAGGNSANWTGGDALTIKMEENTPADPTGVQGSGITITADVEFEESDATIEVPVTPGGSTEEPGGGAAYRGCACGVALRGLEIPGVAFGAIIRAGLVSVMTFRAWKQSVVLCMRVSFCLVLRNREFVHFVIVAVTGDAHVASQDLFEFRGGGGVVA